MTSVPKTSSNASDITVPVIREKTFLRESNFYNRVSFFDFFIFYCFFFLYPQSQYEPPEARVYCRTKSVAPPASLMV